MILHDRTKAAQIFVLCRVHLRACFAHSLLSAATIESLEQGNVSEMHTTILTCSRGIYNVTSVRVQGYVGALARQNTYSTTVQYMRYRRKAVGVAPPRLIYKKKTYTCTWTPNSHKARQEDNVIGATSRQVHVILQYKPIVQYMILPKPRRYLFCADICSVPCAP
jgi:hypothetical protein